MAAKSHRIRAVVRIRPLLPFESKHTSELLVIGPRPADPRAGRVLTLRPKPRSDDTASRDFSVDAVFAPDSSQQDVYDGCNIKSMAAAVCKGYNATVFVYGQTGSGKTFTMEGLAYENTTASSKAGATRTVVRPVIEIDEDKAGIMPRAIAAIYSGVEQLSARDAAEPRRFRVRVSYVQIYNEQVYDLLNPGVSVGKGARTPGLRVRWTKDEDFYVENLFMSECYTPEEALALLHAGVRRKVMAAHSMNASSSRSHCIFTLHVESFAVSSPSEVLSSRFCLVDLAGSERVSRTHATGVTLKESIAINKSLFVLRNVIKALALGSSGSAGVDVDEDDDVTPGPAHFRDSKLTSLLKHSLGGNSLTLMIACVSSSDVYWDENKSTLAYASLAQRISNKLSVNEDPRTRVIRELQKEIAILKDQLAKVVGGLCVRCGGGGGDVIDDNLTGLLQERDTKLKALNADNTLLSLENERLRERVDILEYLLGQSEEAAAVTPTQPHASSAPSSDQADVRKARVRGAASAEVLPLSTTGKLLGTHLPPIGPHTDAFDYESDEPTPVELDAAQAMSELTQLLRTRAGLRKQRK